MSFLEIFTVFASGVSIFALILVHSAVYNTRATRRKFEPLIRETRQETQQSVQEIQSEVRRARLLNR